MEANLLNVYKGTVRIERSALHSKSAAVVGAAALAWKALEKEHAR
ncbi:MAG: hypothetical protein AAF570_26650 [Bacteroidota bacterium]